MITALSWGKIPLSREGLPMTLKLRGKAWYLKKTVEMNGVSKVREFPLKVYGAADCCRDGSCNVEKPKCVHRKVAVVAGEKLEKEINDLNAAAGVMDKLGIEKRDPKAKKDTPTLRVWWDKVKQFYPDSQMRRRVEHWLTLPFEGARTWGAARLDEIKKSDCLAALACRRKQHRRTRSGKTTGVPVAEPTVQKERGIIQAVMQRAVDDELIDRNPWLGIPKPSGPVGRRDDEGELRLLTEEDEPKLLAELKPREARWVRFVLATGLRLEGAIDLRQELLITRGDKVFAHVSEKSKDHKMVCPVCKRVGKKCREVPLLSEAQAIIKAQLEADGALWTNQPGMPSIQKRLAEASRTAGIIRISPHDLRFTFGHRWIKRGGTVDDLSRILGHSDSRITRKHYAYLLPDDLTDKMAAVMEPSGPTPPTPPRSRKAALKLIASA